EYSTPLTQGARPSLPRGLVGVIRVDLGRFVCRVALGEQRRRVGAAVVADQAEHLDPLDDARLHVYARISDESQPTRFQHGLAHGTPPPGALGTSAVFTGCTSGNSASASAWPKPKTMRALAMPASRGMTPA